MSAPKLKWGETPWDDMSREDLLREVQRLHSAAASAHSVLGMIRDGDPSSPFWGMKGTGGRAREKIRQAIAPVLDRYNPEQLFRSFYRYAEDLLFAAPIGYGWAVCSEGHMTAGETPRALDCVICQVPRRLRPITWEDMQPGRPA